LITPRYTYVNVHSKFHDLNPISKAIWLLCMNVLAVFVSDIAWLSFIFLLVFATGLMAGLGLKRLLGAMKLLRPLIIILFFSPAFILLPELRSLSPGSSPAMLLIEAIAYGVTLVLRFSCIIYAVLVFMMTTKLKDFVYAITKLGVPYRYSFMLMIIFRLIPSFERDVNNVMYAQMARGLRLDKTSILKRYTNFIKYTVKPVLISSLRKGLTLAISMDSACFGAYKKRTFLDEVTYSRTDLVFSSILLSITVLIVYASFTGRLPTLFNFSETIRRLFFPSG